jgi:aldehyde dehydrogenase (NAD+)
MWYFGTPAGAKAVELASAANMKRTWTSTRARDWLDPRQGEGGGGGGGGGREFLRHASEVKNIWIPYGE